MAAGIQRPLRGSRISTFYPIKTLPSLSSLDSAFQLQEYISLLIRLDIHDVEAITSLPASKDAKEGEGQTQDSEASGEKQVTVDEACWVYEQLRRLAQDLTHPLITTLQQECTRATCPEMKAGEWLYLCVAHGNEGSMEQCCAIDYILHTLDSATALLSSPRAFPSRLQIPATSHRHFSSLARRLGRIFAHAYFHHREAFEQAEVESSLYARFLALSSKFELVPQEFLPIPPEAFAGHGHEEEEMSRDVQPPRLHAAGVEPQAPIAQQLQNEEPGHFSSSTTRDSHLSHLSLLVPPEPLQGGARSPPGLQSEGSPRRLGRNRTDTMVPSEASSIIEELAARSASEEVVDEPEEHEEVEEPAMAEVEDVIVIPKEEEVLPPVEKVEEPSTDSEIPIEEQPKSEENNVTTDGSQATALEQKPEAVEEITTKDEPPSPESPAEENPPLEPSSVDEQATIGTAPFGDAEAEATAEDEKKAESEAKEKEGDVKEEKEVADEVFGVTTAAPASETPSESAGPLTEVGEAKRGEEKSESLA